MSCYTARPRRRASVQTVTVGTIQAVEVGAQRQQIISSNLLKPEWSCERRTQRRKAIRAEQRGDSELPDKSAVECTEEENYESAAGGEKRSYLRSLMENTEFKFNDNNYNMSSRFNISYSGPYSSHTLSALQAGSLFWIFHHRKWVPEVIVTSAVNQTQRKDGEHVKNNAW